jgi:ATP-dependent 26S proteasome regulatory subunit
MRDIAVDDDVNVERLADLTDGFSCADIRIICKEASMMPMRNMLEQSSLTQIESMRNDGSLSLPKVSELHYDVISPSDIDCHV